MTIALIDYGVGNLRSVKKAFETVGADIVQTDRPEMILNASQVVLPGVGAFKDGMSGLQNRGLISILKQIYQRGTPLLGICLGMQLFFEMSYEMGNCEGLGFIQGRVEKFDGTKIKVPQTGWNQLELMKPSPLLLDIPQNAYVYFNHSYYCKPIKAEDTLTQTNYNTAYASAVQKNALFGVQFHPEKSQKVGLTILKNFVEACS